MDEKVAAPEPDAADVHVEPESTKAPTEAPQEPDEERQPGDWGDVPVLRYTGSSNVRVLAQFDFTGALPDTAEGEAPATLTWDPSNAHSLPWLDVVEVAGSEDAARAALPKLSHEFELIGPGSAEIKAPTDETEEFLIEGPTGD